MATNTLSTYSSTGIQLTTGGAYQSPFTVTATGTIHATGPITTVSSDGIYSSLSGAAVLNLGTIYGANVGVSLDSGGTVTNAAGVTISGGYVGVAIANAAGDVTNAGTITGTAQFGVYLGLGGSLTNTGVISGGYYALVALATATIANTGTISGTAGSGAYMKGGTLTNTGTISGAAKSGIFVAGGSVLNTASYSLIAGGKYGLVAEFATVTVTNAGTIAGGSQEGIFLEGGIITNTGSYSLISGSTTASFRKPAPPPRFSMLARSPALHGRRLPGRRGSVSNTGTASAIYGGAFGVKIHGAAGAITNAGMITGASTDGVYLGDGGAVTNTGTASVIEGGDYGVKIILAAGTITMPAQSPRPPMTGVFLTEGGIVTNTGTITGAETGVYFKYSGGTLINASGGVITGQRGCASAIADSSILFSMRRKA